MAAPLFSRAEPFAQFGRRHHEEQFCEIISNLDQWFWWRCPLKIFLNLNSGALLFSGVEPFMQTGALPELQIRNLLNDIS